MNFDKKKTFIIDFSYYFLWFIIIYFIFKIAAVYLFPFLIGLIIAYTVQKPAQIISKKININKKICAAILSVIFYILFFVFLLAIIWILYLQSQNVIKKLISNGNFKKIIESYFSGFIDNVGKLDSKQTIPFKQIITETINEFVQKISLILSKFVGSFIKKIPAFLISFLITIVSTCYISKDFDRLYLFFNGFISEQSLKKIKDIKNLVFDSFKGFSKGYFLLFIITFVELVFGFLILDISNFYIIAFLISLIDLLPILGTGIVLLPWAVLEIFQYNYYKGIGLVVLYFTIVVVRNFIEPKIIGKQIGINPLFTLVFVFLGLKIGGVIGMITLPVLFSVCFNYFRKQFYMNDEKI